MVKKAAHIAALLGVGNMRFRRRTFRRSFRRPFRGGFRRRRAFSRRSRPLRIGYRM